MAPPFLRHVWQYASLFRINIHPPRATAYDVQHVPAATGSRIENHCGRGRPRTLPLQYATNKYLPAGKTTELIDKALRHNETAVSKFICKKVWIMFVLNKFYYYICKGKEGKPSGRAERGADQTKKTYDKQPVYYHQPNPRGLAQITGERLCIYMDVKLYKTFLPCGGKVFRYKEFGT